MTNIPLRNKDAIPNNITNESDQASPVRAIQHTLFREEVQHPINAALVKSSLNAAKAANVTNGNETTSNFNQITPVVKNIPRGNPRTPDRNETRDIENVINMDKRNSTTFDNTTKEEKNKTYFVYILHYYVKHFHFNIISTILSIFLTLQCKQSIVRRQNISPASGEVKQIKRIIKIRHP